jgi:endonuclease-3 related protein
MNPPKLYRLLLDHYGKQNWWPAESPFEVMIGAILTQRTSWRNVEIAINRLKRAGLLSVDSMAKSRLSTIEENVRSSGFYRVKARRVHNLARHIASRYGSLKEFLDKDAKILRGELLELDGIGDETADSIILYVANKPVFVVDAYTRRLCERIPLPVNGVSYRNIQEFFEGSIPKKVDLYKEFHALIVVHGKENCRTKPLCGRCPLMKLCEYSGKILK